MKMLHDSMVIALTIKHLVIKNMNVDLRLNGHQTSQAIHLNKVTSTIGITIQGIVGIITKSMDTLLRIVEERIPEKIIRND